MVTLKQEDKAQWSERVMHNGEEGCLMLLCGWRKEKKTNCSGGLVKA